MKVSLPKERVVKSETPKSVSISKKESVDPIRKSAPARPVSLKYLSAQEFLLRKGVKPAHIPVYIAKAKSLGYTRATASEWNKLLFNES